MEEDVFFDMPLLLNSSTEDVNPGGYYVTDFGKNPKKVVIEQVDSLGSTSVSQQRKIIDYVDVDDDFQDENSRLNADVTSANSGTNFSLNPLRPSKCVTEPGDNYSEYSYSKVVDFLANVEENPALWDSTDRSYHRHEVKNLIYSQIEEKCSKYMRQNNGATAKTVWKQLEKDFISHSKRVLHAPSGSGRIRKTFDFAIHMEFLDGALHKRKVKNSFVLGTEDVIALPEKSMNGTSSEIEEKKKPKKRNSKETEEEPIVKKSGRPPKPAKTDSYESYKEEDIKKFIRIVQSHRGIWDPDRKEYRRIDEKQKLFDLVEQQCDSWLRRGRKYGDTARRLWIDLTTDYCGFLNEISVAAKKGTCLPDRFKFAENMQFLDGKTNIDIIAENEPTTPKTPKTPKTSKTKPSKSESSEQFAQTFIGALREMSASFNVGTSGKSARICSIFEKSDRRMVGA